jgi:hypothetical protein
MTHIDIDSDSFPAKCSTPRRLYLVNNIEQAGGAR